jgi:hypothetical protein
MLKKFIIWLAKLFGVLLEFLCEIVDNMDVFVKERLSSIA